MLAVHQWTQSTLQSVAADAPSALNFGSPMLWTIDPVVFTVVILFFTLVFKLFLTVMTLILGLPMPRLHDMPFIV